MHNNTNSTDISQFSTHLGWQLLCKYLPSICVVVAYHTFINYCIHATSVAMRTSSSKQLCVPSVPSCFRVTPIQIWMFTYYLLTKMNSLPNTILHITSLI